MLSLQERAALASLGEKINLKKIIDLCNSNEGISNFCGNSKTFWLAALPRAGHVLVSLAFEPLETKYWKLLIDNLGKGVHFKYYYVSKISNPFQGLDTELKSPGEDYGALDNLDLINFYVPGLPLQPSTRGWMVSVIIKNERFKPTVFADNRVFALASNDKNDLPRLKAMLIVMVIDSLDSYYKEHRKGDNATNAYVSKEDIFDVRQDSELWDVDNANPQIYDYDDPEQPLEDIVSNMINFRSPFNNDHLHSSSFNIYCYPKTTEDGKVFYRKFLQVMLSAFRVIKS